MCLLGAVWAAVAAGGQNASLGPLEPRFELRAIKASAWALNCMQAAAESAPILDSSPSFTPAYVVASPANPWVSDGMNYTFLVTTPDRSAYLVREGGIGGFSTTVGPVQLGPCIRRAMLEAQANSQIIAGQVDQDLRDVY